MSGPGPRPGSAPEQASRLIANSVEALPEGALEHQLAEGRPLRVKLGIDPTAPDIHLGHTVVLTKLRQFQDAGHEVVLIVGDFTARVGDPSGRSTQRPVLSEKEIAENAATFSEQAFRVLDPDRTEVRFNSEWLRMAPEDFLGLLARATVARLLEREDFRRRMERAEPVSALELLYPLLQGYDSVAVDADVELGGTDQKFNLLFGRDVQAAYGRAQQSVMTMPILPGLDGRQRMSKSLGNYIAISDPPEEMFGKAMSLPDEAMAEYFRLILGAEPPAGSPPNEAKRALAAGIVARFHGDGAAARAEEAFDRVFVRHEAPDDIEEATIADGEVHLPALLSDLFGISRSEGRRSLAQGGVKLDGRPLDPERLDLAADELDGRVLALGKRRFRRLRVG